MYVCHVAYSMPMGEVAEAFGRDRTTVGHACRMVEDRRDDRAYDTFVAIVERMASANSGGNAGSDFALRRMDDGGAALGTVCARAAACGA